MKLNLSIQCSFAAPPKPAAPAETAEGEGEEKQAVASGKKVVKELAQKLATDSDLLEFKILDLDTLVCQNECSGHGTCHQVMIIIKIN